MSATKIKDNRGHPCNRMPEREKLKIVCDFCAKFSPGMSSCSQCNFDVCRKCSSDKNFPNQFEMIEQLQVKSTWIGLINGCVYSAEDEGKYIYIRVTMRSNGEIDGTGEF